MRLPIILALIVVITLPKDVHGLLNDFSSQFHVASVTVGKLLDRNKKVDTLQVAEANVLLKSSHDTAKGIVGNIR